MFKSTITYHGGTIFGKAVNEPKEVATTVLGFMIVCMYGGPKFIHKMLPVTKLKASFLYDETQKILANVRSSGGEPIAIVFDNNRVNQKFVKLFDRVTPWRTTDNIFLLFDTVHLLKSVRNNWITEKMQEIAFFDDGVQYVAKWNHIRKLHYLESEDNGLAKMSELTSVAANPSPIERQRVEWCLKVFSEHTITALKLHSGMKDENVDGTVIFIEKFLKFWKIINVKSPDEGRSLNDPLRWKIESVHDERLEFLLELAQFAESLRGEYGSKREKKLTRDTSEALAHTCRGLVDMTRFLLENGHSYVLLGKFTTDWLEKLLGKLRQGSGGTYFINV